MSELKTFTIKDIRSWGPCYDPNRYLAEDWSGTAIDLLNIDAIPIDDRLWVVLRDELIDAKTLRLFAVWCARQVEHLMDDDRSKRALDVAERFAYGETSQEELAAAMAASWNAAMAAAMAASWDASRYASRNAAMAAAMAASWDASRYASRYAAMDASRNAAMAASWDASRNASRNAAMDASRYASREAHLKKLIEMLKEVPDGK